MHNLKIEFIRNDIKIVIEEWGQNTVKISYQPMCTIIDRHQMIDELNKNIASTKEIIGDEKTLLNNSLKVSVDDETIRIYHKDQIILEEYYRKLNSFRRTFGIDEDKKIAPKTTSPLNIEPVKFEKRTDNNYQVNLLFKGYKQEKIFGMGSYQEDLLNKNGSYCELRQRNTQTTIPIYISNLNYGFILNNCAQGEVFFGRNIKKWTLYNTNYIEFIVTVGHNPSEIVQNITNMIGKSPLIDQNLLGLWQSKLRYRNLDELKNIYHSYQKRKVDLSALVIDYFHWTKEGEFEFDFDYWQGIDQFSQELNKQNIKLIASVWPTVEPNTKYQSFYEDNQLLIKSKHQKKIFKDTDILDLFNEKTKIFLNHKLKENYIQNGVELFWVDQTEPEMDSYDHHNYEVCLGNFERYANKYPINYLQAIPRKESYPVLSRSAWINSAKFGALLWSGDVESSFLSLKIQIKNSISLGLCGISWFTTDIGGFYSNNSQSNYFKELLIRWFQYATFSPILRMHGDRQPHYPSISNIGGGKHSSGSDNEIWSFGPEVEAICLKYLKIRTELKEYIYELYKVAHKDGLPIIRAMFLEFPDDQKCYEETTQYMFGHKYLVAPITSYRKKKMQVYLPQNARWKNFYTNEVYEGGTYLEIDVNLDEIPVYEKQ